MRRISFGARTYNASIGRFDGVDPLAFAFGEITPYNYVLNNPLIYMDPFGDSTVHVNNLNWQSFNPGRDDILLDEATVKARRNYNYESYSTGYSSGFDGDLNVERPIYRPGGPYTKEQMYQRSGAVEPNYLIESSFFRLPALSLSWLARLFRFSRISSVAAKGVSAEGAVWAQTTFGPKFSLEGKFAGKTLESVIDALKSGTLSAADVPIDVVLRNGQTFILNTRSSAALMQAGIPRGTWNVVNKTGVAEFETMLTKQLAINGLINGTNTIRQSGTTLTLSH